MRRVLYIDGFNFYYGVTSHWSKETQGRLAGFGWCNFYALMERHYPGPGELSIKYFTAPITENVELRYHLPGEHRRYSIWRRALETIPALTVVEGFYQRAGKAPRSEAAESREEKQTDVNVAVEVMVDAFGPNTSQPAEVFLLSGDYDLMPVVFALKERAPVAIDVSVILPSSQKVADWKNAYELTRNRLLKNHPDIKKPRTARPGKPIRVASLDERILVNSLLKYNLRDPAGAFDCPSYWRLSQDYLKQHCRAEWRPD